MGFKIVLGILIIYILGILASVGIYSHGYLSLPVIVLLLFVLIAFLVYASTNLNNKTKVFGLILLVFFIFGFLATSTKTAYISPFKEYTGRLVDVEGMVSGYTVYSNRTVYWLENPVVYFGDERITGKRQERIQLSIYEPTFNYSYGTVVRVREVLRQASPRRNPGGFNFREFLERRNIFTIINTGEQQVTKIGEKRGNPLLRVGLGMRERFANLSYTLIDHEGGIFRALILGETSGITPEDRSIYQGIGVMHIFAVSGLHVGFVMFLLFAITSIFRKPTSSSAVPPPPLSSKDTTFGNINSLFASLFSTNNILNIFIILCLLIYCAAIGFPSPVMRASIMLGIYLWGRENWNNVQTANSLFLAALFLLLLNPLMIFDAGFQLTFIATAFIIFLTPILKTNTYLKKDWIAIPLAAWLGTLPLIAYYFNMFAPLGIITSVPSGFMAGGAIIIGFIAFVIDFFSPSLAQFLMTSVGGIVFYSNYVLQLFAKLPLIGNGIAVATPSLPTIFLYYFAFILACTAYHHRYNPHLRIFILKNYKPVIALILICIIVSLSFPAFAPSYLEVIFLDVGQGDCAIIITPGGRVVLIDGGGMSGNHNMGDLTVVPFLRHMGIRKVDVVISTHPHTDHVAGLYPVLRQFPVDLILIPAGFNEWYGYLKGIVNERGLNYSYARRGQTITLEPNIYLNIIHPSANYPVARGVNNHSIVAELIYKDISFLFTGDIEMDAMNYMLPHLPLSNVLQFPHHGSANTSFNVPYLERVNPEIVVIQVGLNNPFGHPGRVIIEYFEDRNIPIYRNDLHGAISIYSRGYEINRIETVIR